MTTGAYKSAFIRTVQERTDAPVFTVEDAVHQIRNTDGEKRTKLEIAMDEFYLKNLPDDVMGLDEAQNMELDEDNIKRLRQQTKMKDSKTKTTNYLHGQVVNPQRPSVGSNKIQVEGKKKPKSEMTLAHHDSKEIENLSAKMKVANQVDEKRRSTMLDRAGSQVGKPSSPKRGTVMLQGGPDSPNRKSTFGGMINAGDNSSKHLAMEKSSKSDEEGDEDGWAGED